MSAHHTHDGKWIVYHRDTGERCVRWPVDARGMLASGEYVAHDPSLGEATDSAIDGGDVSASDGPATDPVPHVTAANARSDALSPTGAPLAIAPSLGVSSAAPVQLPMQGARTHGPKGRR